MLIYSIDPGIEGLGWAQWTVRPSRTCIALTLHNAGSFRPSRKMTWDERFELVSRDFDRLLDDSPNDSWVFVELPQFFPGGGRVVAGRGDLIKLAAVYGMVRGVASVRSFRTGSVSIPLWKGNAPKEITHRRVFEDIKTMHPNFQKKLETLDEHALDAVGIGLWIGQQPSLENACCG